MKIFVDENIPLITAQTLRKLGHEVMDNRAASEEGMADDLLWQKIQGERRLLITTDKGFTQCRYESHYGILIVCLRERNQSRIHIKVMEAVQQYSEKEWVGLLVVMQESVKSIWRMKQA